MKILNNGQKKETGLDFLIGAVSMILFGAFLVILGIFF